MPGVYELSYVVYEVSDLEDWEHFGVELMGMQYGEETANGFTLRSDDKVHRWVVEEGPQDDLIASGYSVSSAGELDEFARRLSDAGLPVTEGDAALAAARKVDRLLVTTDPMGNRIELVTGFKDGPAFRSKHLLGGFVTGTGGAGHQVLLSKGVSREAYLHFYNDVLGFRTSDVIVEEVAPGVFADLIFLRCNPRHHTVALGDMPFPKRNHHFMMEVTDIRDVGTAWDRCLEAHQPIHMTLGMHPNDNMFSFYVETPSGFNVEYGWGGLLIDDATWEVKRFDKLNNWGHKAAGPVAEQLAGGTHRSKTEA